MTERVGRYELLRKLASGGMGELFLARADSGRTVVVKRLLSHLSTDAALTAQFLREARALASLRHPNVVQVFELGEDAGRFFLVMEHIAGVEAATLQQRGSLSLGAACSLIADAARGLAAAHDARDATGKRLGLAHGDVTPHNLLVDGGGVTKLVDFGLARERGATEGALGGTYEYQAPEQVGAGTVDGRTDQFSLGIIAWELLSGRRLFAGETDVATMDQVVACQVPPLRVEPDLEGVVRRMLSKRPDERFESCEEIARRLEPWAVRAELAGAVGPLLHAPASAAPPLVAPADAVRSTPPLTSEETLALEQLPQGTWPLEVLEAALERFETPALDLLQGLVEAGAIRRRDDGRFDVLPLAE